MERAARGRHARRVHVDGLEEGVAPRAAQHHLVRKVRRRLPPPVAVLRPRRHTQRLDSRHRQQPALLEDGELRVGRRRAALGRPQLRLHRVLHRPDQPLHKLAVRRRLLLAGGGGRRLGCRELVGRKRLLDHLQPLVLDGLGEAHLCGRPGPLVQLLRRDPTLGGHTAKDDRFGAAARHDQLALLGELQRLPARAGWAADAFRRLRRAYACVAAAARLEVASVVMKPPVARLLHRPTSSAWANPLAAANSCESSITLPPSTANLTASSMRNRGHRLTVLNTPDSFSRDVHPAVNTEGPRSWSVWCFSREI